MIEIFSDISEETRQQAEYWVDLALKQSNPLEAVKILTDLRGVQENERDKEFIDFYVNMRLGHLTNE